MNMSEKRGNVWVFVEQEGGKIASVSLQLISKGRELADRLGVKLEAEFGYRRTPVLLRSFLP